MFHDDKKIFFHEDDQCITCEYNPAHSDVVCPLVEALAAKVAYLDGDVAVVNCGFYKAFERRLKLVVDNQGKDDDGSNKNPAI